MTELSEKIRNYAEGEERIVKWADEVAQLEDENAELKRENEELRNGLEQIRTMRLMMPLANVVPVIDALLADTLEGK